MDSCHSSAQSLTPTNGSLIALLGHPNVGKSVIFQRLTGHYVTVSNYSGTTVEVTRGVSQFLPETGVIDTPGLVTFPPRTEDEIVAARVLLDESLRTIVQVGDAKSLRRTLLLTTQLAEMGVPMVLALNMMDEATARGIKVDPEALAARLGLPVVPTVATRNQGIVELKAAIQTAQVPNLRLTYSADVEAALDEIGALLPPAPIATRAVALLWLCGDQVTTAWLAERLSADGLRQITERREKLQRTLPEPMSASIQRMRRTVVDQVVGANPATSNHNNLSSALGRLAIHPVWGLPILAVVLYGLYWFVGIFGAGTLVGFVEKTLFGEIINPWLTGWVDRLIPIPIVVDLLVGDYGLWTMGMTYALALILPIVTTFFIAFGILEDSGYLPRLSVLGNRIFKTLGLNGKAVLPMVLGLGCVTMATMTTRILESKRDRLLVILLLALAVPCSAQLGVVMGLLAGVSLSATLIWAGFVILTLLVVGWLAARLVPGERTPLLVEIPPLRLPVASNVLIKTLARLEWYLKEVIPLFLFGTVIMFVLDQLSILPWLIEMGKPLVTGWLGLPPEASAAFLLGFLRRDFGATGLFVLESKGLLSPIQVVVAMVTITLFIPCIASIFMIARERGTRTALALTALIFPLAFVVGGLINRLLIFVGWNG
jgi:ferrous iron transport protein B